MNDQFLRIRRVDQNFPEPIKITIYYDAALEAVTGKDKEAAWVSEEMPFSRFLSIIFASYPEIEERYPPGVLGFAINGRPPGELDTLKDGDKVSFQVAHA